MAPEQDEAQARFLNRAANHRLLTAREEVALSRRALKGDEGARHELINCNIRLVVSISRYYRNRGVPMEDVIQEGMLGLDRASRKFDPERGFRFSTYATLWIRQSIQRGLSGGGASMIRLPPQVADDRAKARSALVKEPGLTVQELADLLKVDLQRIDRALAAAEVVTSLDREVSVDDEAGHTLMDTLTDPYADDPQELTMDAASLREALLLLPKPQRRILELRFGFGDKPPLSLQDVAASLKLTTAAVQSGHREALRRLRELLLDS